MTVDYLLLFATHVHAYAAFDPVRAKLDIGTQGNENDCKLNNNDGVVNCSPGTA